MTKTAQTKAVQTKTPHSFYKSVSGCCMYGKWPKRPMRMSKTAHTMSPKRLILGRFRRPKRPTYVQNGPHRGRKRRARNRLI